MVAHAWRVQISYRGDHCSASSTLFLEVQLAHRVPSPDCVSTHVQDLAGTETARQQISELTCLILHAPKYFRADVPTTQQVMPLFSNSLMTPSISNVPWPPEPAAESGCEASAMLE